MTDSSRAEVCFDTNAFVYALQASGETSVSVLRLLSGLSQLEIKPLTSELTLAEVLCKRDMTPQLMDTHRDLLVESGTIRLQPVTREILLRSAEMRRPGSSLKLQDAIHMATARSAGCRFMMSNDADMRVAGRTITIMSPTEVDVDHILDALNV